MDKSVFFTFCKTWLRAVLVPLGGQTVTSRKVSYGSNRVDGILSVSDLFVKLVYYTFYYCSIVY